MQYSVEQILLETHNALLNDHNISVSPIINTGCWTKKKKQYKQAIQVVRNKQQLQAMLRLCIQVSGMF